MIFRCLLILVVTCLSLGVGAAKAQIVDFEDLPSLAHPLAPNSYYNGADNAGQFISRGATFNNSFTDYGGGVTSWEGWAYSDQTVTPATADLSQPDYTYQYSAAPGVGSRGSAQYGIGYTNTFVLPAPIITLPLGEHPVSLQVTNTTYDAISMLYGDQFAKQFSGPVGATPGDWFKLTITGLDASSQPIGSVDFYLADFRSANPAQDYILNTWQNVNLTSLSGATALSFALSSSDTGQFGMNTPAYFAADDLSLTKQAGDLNGDGLVNAQDIAVIASHWLAGTGSGTSGAAVVPEPAAIWLAALGLASLVLGIKLRR